MMTCSSNLFKHLKHCYQTKTNSEISQHDFHCFENLMTLKKKSDQIFSFHIYFSHLSKISNPKKKGKEKRLIVTICVFECFQS
jgi:hypothetical protein